MSRQLFAILLTANLLTCPFYCGAKSVEDGHSVTRRACCCQKCARRDSLGNSNEQPQEDPAPCCCQCICGGAVVDDVAVSVGNPDWSCWDSLAILDVEQLLPGTLVDRTYFIDIQPDDGMNRGRAMRYLFMSLTC